MTIPFMADYDVRVERVPHGVTAHIIPWNYPAQMFGRTLAPALAMGNATVIKPSEDACLSGIEIAKLAIEAGFPPGAINLVPGYGHEAGAPYRWVPIGRSRSLTNACTSSLGNDHSQEPDASAT